MSDRKVIRPTALKRLKDTYRGNGVLLPRVERHVMKTPQMDIRPDDHSLEYMHPSDMAKSHWCGRHDFYRIVNTAKDKDRISNPSFRMENVLAEGHTIHEKYQRWLHEMGVLWGNWRCLECGHSWGALSPECCQFCRSPRIVYKELELRRTQMKVEGHADAAVHAEWFRGLVEIKSIGINTLRFEAPRLYNLYQDGQSAEDIWFSISKPFGTHLRQGQLYLWMTWPTYEQIIFIYESKFHQQVKEFVVSYNKALIAPILETAREVTYALRKGQPPPRPVWAEDPDGKVCGSCEYRRTCWNIGGSVDRTKARDPTPVLIKRTTTARRKRALRQA
jgi:rubrerythrin